MKRALHDRTGAAAIEFAIVVPLLLFTVLGGLDLGYNEYVRSVLEGEMHKASRDRTLESNSDATNRALLETRVRELVHDVSHGATVSFTHRSFSSYSTVSRPEFWVDADGNGLCDGSEVYQDMNENGVWDAVAGRNDTGGAKDVVVYTATVSYPRLMGGDYFPWGSTGTVTAKTMLRNQPYDRQKVPVERPCVA